MISLLLIVSVFAAIADPSSYYKVDKDGYITASKWQSRLIQSDPGRSRVVVDIPKYGMILGGIEDSAEYFLGMPYAKSPIGPLRFMPAQEFGVLGGTLNASEFCPSVVGASERRQTRSTTIPNDAKVRTDEDALCINIWRPAGTTASAQLPIMVFIYGGGFVSGSSSNAWYDGKNLAQYHDRVVVTFNYRVGPLGFFSSEQLVSSGSGNGGANGLLDQVQALKWLQKHGASFGGDVSNVGLFGESAGALSVCSHVVSPRSAGLFKRAVLESGPCSGPWAAGEKKDGLAISQLLMNKLNCSDIECLRGLPSSRLASWPWDFESNHSLETDWKLNPYDWQFPGYWVDDFFLSAQQYELFANSTINADAVMVIANSMDGFLSFLYPDVHDYPKKCGDAYMLGQRYHWEHFSPQYPQIAEEVEKLYPCQHQENEPGKPVARASWQFALADRDYSLHCASNALAETLTRRGVPVWRGTFSVGPRQYDQACIDKMIPCCQQETSCYGWASHGAEIPFVFNTTSNACKSESICGEFVDPFTGYEPALVLSMQEYWVSFLATGTPVDKSGNGPEWPPASKGIANLTTPSVIIEPSEILPLGQQCQFWSQYYPGQRSHSLVFT